MFNSIVKARVTFDPRRSTAFAAITNAYVIVGSTFANQVKQIKIVNDTNANMDISYNGVTDQDIVLANSAFVYDYDSNKSDQAKSFEQAVGAGVYIKYQTVPTAGSSVYVVVIYAS